MKLLDNVDPSRVRDRMVALSEKERRALAKEAEQDFDKLPWHSNRASRRYRAAALAWLGTATARKLVSDFWHVGWELGDDHSFEDDAYAVLASRGKHFVKTFARGVLRDDLQRMNGWRLVRRAVREGLIERPEGPEYVEGLIFGISNLRGQPKLDESYRALLRDPDLLEDDVWRIFEVDVASTLANASTWEDSGAEIVEGVPKYERGDNHWRYALVRLAAEGRLDRQRLLDASLDALMRDFRPTTVGWYAELHEALEPTRGERRARVDRYLALLANPAPAAVKEGLAALKAMEKDVPAEGLARVAPSTFAHRQKNLAVETLRLLERMAKGDELARPLLLEAAAHALAHERPDVQERALKLLERFPGESPRAALLGYVDAVSPTLRERLAALTGVEAPAAPEVRVRDFAEPRVPDPAPGGALEPVADVDELIELAASLLEGQASGDDAERFLDGVARLCDERPPPFKERTAGLLKQAGEQQWWSPALGSGNDLVATVVRAWARGERPKASSPKETLAGALAYRALEVAERAARRRPRALLAFPTHAGGWLDAEVVESRDTTTGGMFRRDSPDHYDRVGARLRTVHRAELELRPVVYKVGENTRVKYEWGPLPAELADVAEIPLSLRKLGRSSFQWWTDDTIWLAGDTLGARWLLTIVPALPEIQFARALTAIVDRIDETVYRHPEVVLEHALDAGVPMRDPAWAMVAAALLAKSPDLQRLAVDVIVATVEDERFDAQRLGRGLALLLDNEVGSATRLTQPLRDAGRVSPLHAAQVVRAVEALVVQASGVPKNLHAPLEAAAELAAECGYRVTGEGRDALERVAATVSPSAKLAKMARALIG